MDLSILTTMKVANGREYIEINTQNIWRSKKLDLYLHRQKIQNRYSMPTIFEIFGLRFFFYSDEHLPIHVHIEYGGNDAKIEIATRKVVQNRGLKPRELKKATQLVEMYEQEIIKAWHDYFDKE